MPKKSNLSEFVKQAVKETDKRRLGCHLAFEDRGWDDLNPKEREAFKAYKDMPSLYTKSKIRQ